MENIVAHSLEKLYMEFEKADQIFLDSGMKDMAAYEEGLAEAARRSAAEHMQGRKVTVGSGTITTYIAI